MTRIQIFGSPRSADTRKAQRFFQDRRVDYQLIDLREKGMSKGELESVVRTIPPEQLLDTESREYEKLNLAYIQHDPFEKLLEHPTLFRMPVVRFGREATVGLAQETWKQWLKP